MIVADEDKVRLVIDVLSDALARKAEYGDSSWGSEEWTIQEVKNLMTQGPVFLFYVDTKLAGTVQLIFGDDEKWKNYKGSAAYIHRLAVKKEFSGLGVGTKILDWAKVEAVKHRVKFLRLDCDAKNEKLGGYYEKYGFNKVGASPAMGSNYVAALYELAV